MLKPSLTDDEQVPQLPIGTVTFLFTDIEGSTRRLRTSSRASSHHGPPAQTRTHVVSIS